MVKSISPKDLLYNFSAPLAIKVKNLIMPQPINLTALDTILLDIKYSLLSLKNSIRDCEKKSVN